MSRWLKLNSLLIILVAGSVFSLNARISTPALAKPAATAVATAQATPDIPCAVTWPTYDQPPKDPNADSFGMAYWYINADRTIWVGSLPDDQSWRAGDAKVAWIRPTGTQLEISGHRLDADAPPLHAEIPSGYLTGFQVTGMIFPTEGCWQVDARSGPSKLTFVTRVKPSEHPVPTNNACGSLAEIVAESDTVMVGNVTGASNTEGYSWLTVWVVDSWKLPPGWSSLGDWFSIVQDRQTEPALTVGKQYVFFLQYAPWRIVCPQRTLVERTTDGINAVGTNPLWTGKSLDELRAEVKHLVSTP